MRRAPILALVLLGLASARAEDDPQLQQLWVDHAVAAADHVAEGDYEGGTLRITAELKGKFDKKVVYIERGDVELGKDDLAPKATPPGGHGILFLQERLEQKGMAVQRLIGWNGPGAVAWIRSDVCFYRPSSEDPDRLAPTRVCTEREFRAALARAFERQKALAGAVAVVD